MAARGGWDFNSFFYVHRYRLQDDLRIMMHMLMIRVQMVGKELLVATVQSSLSMSHTQSAISSYEAVPRNLWNPGK